jgi:AcrR family transcriptional regulator
MNYVGQPVNRRQDVIDAAVALLQEGGPDALTTVAVAARLGVTQSAIYRHVRNVDELATVASRQVVAAMQERLRTGIVGSGMVWGGPGVTRKFCDLIVSMMATDSKSFELVDRWRYADGALGAGIREMLREGNKFGCEILESEWRKRYGHSKPLTRSLSTLQQTYADLMQDDVIRVARIEREGGFPGGHDAIARVLELRWLGGYLAYSSDMNTRLGLETVIN